VARMIEALLMRIIGDRVLRIITQAVPISPPALSNPICPKKK